MIPKERLEFHGGFCFENYDGLEDRPGPNLILQSAKQEMGVGSSNSFYATQFNYFCEPFSTFEGLLPQITNSREIPHHFHGVTAIHNEALTSFENILTGFILCIYEQENSGLCGNK